MGFKFRKRIKICNGVSLNIGKTGINSISVGKRGANVNINSKGIKGNVGINGTGLGYETQRYGGNTSSSNQRKNATVADVVRNEIGVTDAKKVTCKTNLFIAPSATRLAVSNTAIILTDGICKIIRSKGNMFNMLRKNIADSGNTSVLCAYDDNSSGLDAVKAIRVKFKDRAISPYKFRISGEEALEVIFEEHKKLYGEEPIVDESANYNMIADLDELNRKLSGNSESKSSVWMWIGLIAIIGFFMFH